MLKLTLLDYCFSKISFVKYLEKSDADQFATEIGTSHQVIVDRRIMSYLLWVLGYQSCIL